MVRGRRVAEPWAQSTEMDSGQPHHQLMVLGGNELTNRTNRDLHQRQRIRTTEPAAASQTHLSQYGQRTLMNSGRC
jgi:hypothetical protein